MYGQPGLTELYQTAIALTAMQKRNAGHNNMNFIFRKHWKNSIKISYILQVLIQS